MSHQRGEDGLGRTYENASQLWSSVDASDVAATTSGWYGSAIQYWSNTPATVDGVLGGFGHVSRTDVEQSASFLREAASHLFDDSNPRTLCALDCGAGVGRVTNEFLKYHFHEVHLVEPVESLLEEARRKLKSKRKKTEKGEGDEGVAQRFEFFCEPLQTFEPKENVYDVIWIQWVIGHLTDEHFLDFFARCARGLREGGMLFLKENNTSQDRGFVVDNDDSSVTRSDAYLCELFDKANYSLVAKRRQTGFPKELYPVRMYALKPPSSREGAR